LAAGGQQLVLDGRHGAMNPAGRVRWATAIATSPSKARIFLLRVVTVMARGEGDALWQVPAAGFESPRSGRRNAKVREGKERRLWNSKATTAISFT
jgi:hypothetical protein